MLRIKSSGGPLHWSAAARSAWFYTFGTDVHDCRAVTDAAIGRVYDLRPLMGDRGACVAIWRILRLTSIADYEAKDEAREMLSHPQSHGLLVHRPLRKFTS